MVKEALVCVGGILLGTSELRAQTADDQVLFEKSYLATKVRDSKANLSMKLITDNGDTRERKVQIATKLNADGRTSSSLLKFVYPSDVKGTTVLLVENKTGEDDMWIYLPAFGKTRRLVSNNKRDAFVGSDLSFGDILGHKPEDWMITRVTHTVSVTGRLAIIESTARTDKVRRESGYSRRVSTIDESSAIAIKTDYWDEEGAALKTVTASEIKLVDQQEGKYQFMHLEVLNMQTGHRTTFQLTDFRANTGVASSDFSPANLDQGR